MTVGAGQGRGRGVYVGFRRQKLGANEHTIRFGGGEPVALKLRGARWTVQEVRVVECLSGSRVVDVRAQASTVVLLML